MFIGRWFDSDGDGDSDFFVGGKLQPPTPEAGGCVVALLFIGMAIIAIEINSKWIYEHAGLIGWFIGFFAFVAALSPFLQVPKALLLSSLLFGGGFGFSALSRAWGVNLWLLLILFAAMLAVGIVALAVIAGRE